MSSLRQQQAMSLDLSAHKVAFSRSKQLHSKSKLRQELSTLAKINYYKTQNVKEFFKKVKLSRRTGSYCGSLQTIESCSSILTDDSIDYRMISSRNYNQKFLLEVFRGKTVEQLAPISKNYIQKLNFDNLYKKEEQEQDEYDDEINQQSSRFTLAVDYGVKF